jgi:DNA-3-methyladenine glycosylase
MGDAGGVVGVLEPIERDWFERPTLELARALLGMWLVHEEPEGTTAGRIVEVEAYLGPDDRAAHSFGGRRTPRTEAMFGPSGIAYLYRSYGIHVCFDVVSGGPGKPEAILVRALEPVQGVRLMCDRRKLPVNGERLPHPRLISGGPGRLSEALHITMDQYGHPLWERPLYVAPDAAGPAPLDIAAGPRIGIENAGEARAYPWRYWIAGHPAVSRPPARP